MDSTKNLPGHHGNRVRQLRWIEAADQGREVPFGIAVARPSVFSAAERRGRSRLYVFSRFDLVFVFGFPLGEQQLTAVMAWLLLLRLLMVKLTMVMMMMVVVII